MSQLVSKYSNLSEKELKKLINKSNVEDLIELKDYLDEIYYNSSEISPLTDWEYDIIKDSILLRKTNYDMPIGKKVREADNRVKLPYFMGSLDKFKPDDEDAINRWMDTNKSSSYIIEEKLDGISALLTYDENGSMKLYTRGKGDEGGDVSHMIPYLNLPELSIPLVVRGELIMEKRVFDKKYSKTYSAARNMVAGQIGAKTLRSGISDIKFVAYEIINRNDTYEDSPEFQLKQLEAYTFNIVKHLIIPDIDVPTLMSLFVEFKEKSKYEMDGLVIQPNKEYIRNTSGNPSYAFAFKMRTDGDIVETTVTNIIWNVSKWGRIKPIIEYEPRNFGGVFLTYATGFNAKYIQENNIGVGSIIKVTRSGDVIPYVVKVVKSTVADMPDVPYHWNETGVDIIIDECSDEMCVKLIIGFFAQINAKHVGESTIRKLYANGYDTVLKILSVKPKDIEHIEGFQKKSSERICESIKTSLTNVNIGEILGASGVFGFGMGKRKIVLLLNEFPDIFQVYNKLSQEELYNRIISIQGYSDISAEKIVQNIKWADKFLKALEPYMTVKTSVKTKELQNMTIVFSNVRNKQLEAEITDKGGKVTTSVSKNTTAVVTDDVNANTGKLNSARKLGIPIYTIDDFREKMNF